MIHQRLALRPARRGVATEGMIESEGATTVFLTSWRKRKQVTEGMSKAEGATTMFLTSWRKWKWQAMFFIVTGWCLVVSRALETIRTRNGQSFNLFLCVQATSNDIYKNAIVDMSEALGINPGFIYVKIHE
jgi:hypothetical protein